MAERKLLRERRGGGGGGGGRWKGRGSVPGKGHCGTAVRRYLLFPAYRPACTMLTLGHDGHGSRIHDCF